MIKVKREQRKRVNRVAVTKSDSSGKRVTNGNVNVFWSKTHVEHMSHMPKNACSVCYTVKCVKYCDAKHET